MLANILAVGLMASVMSFSPRYVVDNQNETITFSAEELNNNSYQYLANKLNAIGEVIPSTLTNSTITYNSQTLNYEELVTDDYLSYTKTDAEFNVLYSVQFFLNDAQNYAKWIYQEYSEQAGELVRQDFAYSMTINNAEWFIANIEEPPTLTLSKYDLNNKKYTYLAKQMNNLDGSDLPTELTNATITYNSETFNFEELVVNNKIYYISQSENYQLGLNLDETSNNYAKWYLIDDTQNQSEYVPLTASMTINNAEWYLENMYAPLDSGDMMTAITSGLPLMANLAQAFLNGFTSIFWNSTTSSLTTFSMFALIMLSVAIVFACIKLVLNVVRSNTGV